MTEGTWNENHWGEQGEKAAGVARGGKRVVRNYLERCASQAIKSGREEEVFDELMAIIFRLTR